MTPCMVQCTFTDFWISVKLTGFFSAKFSWTYFSVMEFSFSRFGRAEQGGGETWTETCVPRPCETALRKWLTDTPLSTPRRGPRSWADLRPLKGLLGTARRRSSIQTFAPPLRSFSGTEKVRAWIPALGFADSNFWCRSVCFYLLRI
jgi:hypothetical protein